MSLVIDVASDRVTYQAAAPPAAFTITGWVYLGTDQNTYSTFCRVWDAGVSTVGTWGTDADGTSGPAWFTASGSLVQSTGFVVGEWRKVGVTRNGSAGIVYVATPEGATEVDSGTVSTATPAGITLGGRSHADDTESFNGRLAHFRVWDGILSQAQIEAEWVSPTPVVTSGLWADWPLISDLTDASGNGRTLAPISGTPEFEDGPPIPSGPPPGRLLIAC